MLKSLLFRSATGERNFGDELNLWMWRRYIPEEFFLRNEGQLLGIGTLIRPEYIKERPLVIFGTGAGFARFSRKDLEGASVRFVRGPRTAAAIGQPNKWITDPGVIVADQIKNDSKKLYECSFMPHWETEKEQPTLRDALAEEGIHYISPTRDVDTVLSEIAASEKLLTEAMHGAVCADALRVPWVPLYFRSGHTFKWYDWCSSIEIHYDPVDLNIFAIDTARSAHPELSTDHRHRINLSRVKDEMFRLKDDMEHGEIR